MALDHYHHYWRTARGMGAEQARQRQRQIRANADISGTWGSGGDPIGSQTPAAQNQLFGHLAEMAAGRIDDWESLIDPTQPYGWNKANLIDNGASKPKTDVKRERKAEIKDANDRAQKHAHETLANNFDDIEAGNAPDLVEDIETEFSEDFVESVLEAERIERETAGEGSLPEPSEISENTEESTETPPDAGDTVDSIETTETPETPDPEPAETPVEPVSVETSTETTDDSADTERQEATKTRRKPDYSGILGTVRLLVHWILASNQAGQNETKQSRQQSKLSDY